MSLAGLFAAALALPAPLGAAEAEPPKPKPELVRFNAGDGTPLAADFVKPKAGRPAVVLLHGVAAGRGEWWRLRDALHAKGIGSLALDFRGHGSSGGKRFDQFRTKEDWAGLELDIDAAVKFLADSGVSAGRVSLVGGSLGANLAARAGARLARLKCLVLLSPGIEYRGVGLEEPLKERKGPLFVAASPSDGYAWETFRHLHGKVPAATVFDQAPQGHGAQLLDDADFLGRLAAWLSGACAGEAKATPKPSPKASSPKPPRKPASP